MITNDTGFEKSNRIGKFFVHPDKLDFWKRNFAVEIIEQSFEKDGRYLITGRSLYFEELVEGDEIPLYEFGIETFEFPEEYYRKFCRKLEK